MKFYFFLALCLAGLLFAADLRGWTLGDLFYLSQTESRATAGHTRGFFHK